VASSFRPSDVDDRVVGRAAHRALVPAADQRQRLLTSHDVVEQDGDGHAHVAGLDRDCVAL